MSYARTFIEGMRSAFDFAPKQKTYKANFITQANTLQVDVVVPSAANAGAWISIGSHMQRATDLYVSKHPTQDKAILSARQQ